jgi:energy-coupling factor transporter ATP-binding protein EcfA2
VSAPRVALDGVTFAYPGRPAPALREVTVALEAGVVAGVTGPVGAGCSTLLLVAGGFAPRLTGGALTGVRRLEAASVGIVFSTPWTQLSGLATTVRAEVAFGPAASGKPRDAVAAAVARALADLGVAHLADRDPTTLSGGELQRVIVASVLAMGPELLVLDDPAAELDPAAADALFALLPAVARRGAAVLVASPDLERLARSADRVLVLGGGRVLRDGAPAQVLDDTDVARIASAAGCAAPLPLDVGAAVARLVR